MIPLTFFYFLPPGVHPIYYVLMLVAIVITIAAQWRVKSVISKYHKVPTRSGLTGSGVAKMILDARGVTDVKVEQTQGFMGDHYDPRDKTLRLSAANFDGRSVSALGIAAHEVGHAIQHADGYAWLNFRTTLVPVVSICSKLAMPLVMIGTILMFVRGPLAVPVLTVAAIGLAGAVVFSLVTLPVEIDASMRAVRILGNSGILVDDELSGAKTVLRAAAYTYVAAAAVAIIELLKVILMLLAARNR